MSWDRFVRILKEDWFIRLTKRAWRENLGERAASWVDKTPVLLLLFVYFMPLIGFLELAVLVLRQNIVRLSDSLGSVRSAAKALSLAGGRATAILRPAALPGHTGFARRTGSGQAERNL